MLEWLTADALAALATLTALEIVLGIDNIVFIAIVTGRLEPAVQPRARQIGLLAAMGTRILLLLAIKWIMTLDEAWFTVFGQSFSGKDLILLGGGLFLLAKATYEIHHKLEVPTAHTQKPAKAAASFAGAIVQIMLIDVVFSLDSVITAVGMAKQVGIMIAAIVIAIGVMMVFANSVSRFVEQHPTMKMLALAFLILIGVLLVAEGFHQHINRAYVYFAMAFSLGVELLNMRARLVRRRTAALATSGNGDGSGSGDASAHGRTQPRDDASARAGT
jgi:predicted tellurium resistance membrane protein TerC